MKLYMKINLQYHKGISIQKEPEFGTSEHYGKKPVGL